MGKNLTEKRKYFCVSVDILMESGFSHFCLFLDQGVTITIESLLFFIFYFFPNGDYSLAVVLQMRIYSVSIVFPFNFSK